MQSLQISLAMKIILVIWILKLPVLQRYYCNSDGFENSGISFETMEVALQQAKEGRMHILSVMNEVISKSRESISSYAPTLLSTKIRPEKIGALIGPGGKMYRQSRKNSVLILQLKKMALFIYQDRKKRMLKELKNILNSLLPNLKLIKYIWAR